MSNFLVALISTVLWMCVPTPFHFYLSTKYSIIKKWFKNVSLRYDIRDTVFNYAIVQRCIGNSIEETSIELDRSNRYSETSSSDKIRVSINSIRACVVHLCFDRIYPQYHVKTFPRGGVYFYNNIIDFFTRWQTILIIREHRNKQGIIDIVPWRLNNDTH